MAFVWNGNWTDLRVLLVEFNGKVMFEVYLKFYVDHKNGGLSTIQNEFILLPILKRNKNKFCGFAKSFQNWSIEINDNSAHITLPKKKTQPSAMFVSLQTAPQPPTQLRSLCHASIH